MENINKIVDIKTNNLERSLLSEYVKALKNDEFKLLVTKLKLEENIAMKYTSKLERCMEELSNCSKCKGCIGCKNMVKGYVYYPHRDKDRLIFDYVACKYEKKRLIDEKKKSLVFEEPIAIQNAKMSDIDLTDKNRVHVIKWINNFYKKYSTNKNIKGLFLHGSFGSGKSYLISALLNEIAKSGNDNVIIIYYPEMLRKLKESFYDDFEEKMDMLKKCDVLLIDDIGAESVSNWNRDEILGTILQYRMDSKLATFLTSNLNISELETHLAMTKNGVDIVKSKRIIERIKQLTEDLELVSENRRK